MEFHDAANVGAAYPEMLLTDGAVWATEEDYRAWNGETPLNSSHDSRSSSEQPPNKRSRNNSSQSQNGGDSMLGSGNNNINSNRAKAIGKMFFKTKLCCKFRAGVCPYISNCNFAHGIEEQRRPPPNWQEIVASREDVAIEAPREERQIPTYSCSESRGESYKGRHCKKFYTEEGCPYGDSCTFLHDEQSRDRESVAISLSPSVGGGGFGNSSSSGNGGGGGHTLIMKPSNWKTRICNKWETTGSCPFGSKCHFAHGLQEVHKYGGGLMDEDKEDVSWMEWKPAETTAAAVPHSEMYHQRPSSVLSHRATPQRAFHKWKGPDKISKIYGDWIDDVE